MIYTIHRGKYDNRFARNWKAGVCQQNVTMETSRMISFDLHVTNCVYYIQSKSKIYIHLLYVVSWGMNSVFIRLVS